MALLVLVSLACSLTGGGNTPENLSAEGDATLADSVLDGGDNEGANAGGSADAGDGGHEMADPDASEGSDDVLSGEVCLVGTWQMDNQSYEDFLNTLAVSSTAVGDLSYQDVSGSAQVTFSADGVVSNNLDGFSFTACSSGACNTFNVPSSTTTFTYSAETGVVNFAGGSIVAANFTDFGLSDLFGQTAFYQCAGNQMTTEYAGYPPILWVRAE